MKALALITTLGASFFLLIAIGMTKLTVFQFVIISSLFFCLQVLTTIIVFNLFKPVGISKRQLLMVLGGSLFCFLVMMAMVISGRQQVGLPLTLVTDSAIQTEVALKYLDQGINPYTQDYYGTALESYSYPKSLALINPALESFVYLPTVLWASYPAYKIFQWLDIFYDQRYVLLLAYLLLVFIVYQGLKNNTQATLLTVPLLILNPWLTYNVIAGQNDIFPLTIVVAAFVCWQKKWFSVGTILLALAATSKQTVWFVLPFAMVYLWQTYKDNYGSVFKKKYCQQIGWFLLTAVLSLTPFLLWDAEALLNDTLGYILGTTKLTYPIWGVGLGEIIYRLGIIDSRQASWPFAWVQLIVAVPLLFFLIRRQLSLKPSLAYVFGAWGLWLGGSWLVSRFFAPAHLGFIMTLLALSFLLKSSPTEPTAIS